jgi:hypothetical protein
VYSDLRTEFQYTDLNSTLCSGSFWLSNYQPVLVLYIQSKARCEISHPQIVASFFFTLSYGEGEHKFRILSCHPGDFFVLPSTSHQILPSRVETGESESETEKPLCFAARNLKPAGRSSTWQPNNGSSPPERLSDGALVLCPCRAGVPRAPNPRSRGVGARNPAKRSLGNLCSHARTAHQRCLCPCPLGSVRLPGGRGKLQTFCGAKPCLVFKNFCKIFQIFHHIKSLYTCMKY